jgi:hypothetical protein
MLAIDPYMLRVAKQYIRTQHTLQSFEHRDLTSMLQKFSSFPAPNSKKIILVRHGESWGNVTRKIYGHTDFGLTPNGETQAKSLHPHLEKVMPKIDHIFSSDLLRAYNTARLSLGHGPDTATGVDGKIYLGFWCIFERGFWVMICQPSGI